MSGEAIVLKVKPQSCGSFLVQLFTEEYGVLTGLVRGGHKKLSDLQLGNLVEFEHTRRLETQLGSCLVHVFFAPISLAFTSVEQMLSLQYLCELLSVSLKEGESYPKLYLESKRFLKELPADNLWARIGCFELNFLSSIGYGLSLLEEDAVRLHDDNSPLSYVSPRSGRAVSLLAGAPYKEKILPLPAIFGGESKDLLDVFRLTGHFLSVALEGEALQTRINLIQYAKQG